MGNSTERVMVRVETELGDIDIVLNVKAAPRTASYFLELVDEGSLNNVSFHRVGPSIVSDSQKVQFIEGGAMSRSLTGEDRRPLNQTGMKLLKNFETTNESGLRHIEGAVSLARDLAGTGDAIPDFFICLDSCPQLNEDGRAEPDARGFPVFAMVEKGIELAGQIAAGNRNGATQVKWLAGQILAEPIKIVRVSRL